MNITEEQLKLYVDNVFKKYDNNGNFVLEEDELYLFFKDLFASMNFKHQITMQDVRHSLKQIDVNNDGKVTKRQLYNTLKLILKVKPSTGNKQTNVPYQQQKQQKQHREQEPPRQISKQQMQRQQQKQQQQQQHQNNKPNTGNKHHDNNAQLQQQQKLAQQKQLAQQQQQQQMKQMAMQMQMQNNMMDPFGMMHVGRGQGFGGMYGGMGPYGPF